MIIRGYQPSSGKEGERDREEEPVMCQGYCMALNAFRMMEEEEEEEGFDSKWAHEDLLGMGGSSKLDDDDLGGEEEEEIDIVGESEEDLYFDEVVGAIEGILLDQDFVDLQRDFCVQHAEYFEEGEENKLAYTDIFNQYTNTLENFLESRLSETLEGFSMPRFMVMLEDRDARSEVTGDVIDLLLSLTDFHEFKSLMLAHKKSSSSSFPPPQPSRRPRAAADKDLKHD